MVKARKFKIMRYRSTKTYGHDLGFSCAFRQWKANSHCNKMHGYSLSFHFEFEADELDANGWVVDFGSLKSLKQILTDNFDHKTIISEDDPEIEWFLNAHSQGILDLNILKKVGCEGFAEVVYNIADVWLNTVGYKPRVRLNYVKVSEHGANSASYYGD